MKPFQIWFFLLLATAIINGCKPKCEIPETLTYAVNPPEPIPGTSVSVPYAFLKDICYGTHPLQRFDILLPESLTPTPVVIHIHGGAFVSQDKDKAYDNPGKIAQLLNAKIALVTMNYRLLETDYSKEGEGIKKCIADVFRCIQFLRYNADDLNLDKTRFSLRGHSAGGALSLLAAFSNDMAVFGAAGLEGESTLVQAAVGLDLQATYDLEKWGSEVFDGILPINDIVTMLTSEDPYYLHKVYGDPSLDLSDLIPSTAPYRYDVDILRLMEEAINPPPFLIISDNPNDSPPFTVPQLNHHPRHGAVLKQKAESLTGLNFNYKIPHIYTPSYVGMAKNPGVGYYTSDIDFLIDKLQP